MTSQFRRLFSPVKLGAREAKNRIVSTPHGAAFGEKGGITDRYIRYHEEKARGGCGVVMMFGSSSIHPTSVNDWGEVNNWDDSIIPQFRRMSEAIHRHETPIRLRGVHDDAPVSHRGRSVSRASAAVFAETGVEDAAAERLARRRCPRAAWRRPARPDCRREWWWSRRLMPVIANPLPSTTG